MTRRVPRMRMFAGPNGSGKSTINTVLPPELVGVYVNPDEIQKELAATGALGFSPFKLKVSGRQLLRFLAESSLLAAARREVLARAADVRGNTLRVPAEAVDAYLASVISDFIRRRLIDAGESFTFETVMSSPDKVRLIDEAKAKGFRTYLYFIATDDPEINVSRVENRVGLGGHPVPRDKIIERYQRSLGLLLDAVRKVDRAYLWDNSGSEPIWLAEVTDGTTLVLRSDDIPNWFQEALLEKLADAEPE